MISSFAGTTGKQGAARLSKQARANIDSAIDDAIPNAEALMMDAAQDAGPKPIEETLEDVITQLACLATVGLALGLGFLIGATWRR